MRIVSIFNLVLGAACESGHRFLSFRRLAGPAICVSVHSRNDGFCWVWCIDTQTIYACLPIHKVFFMCPSKSSRGMPLRHLLPIRMIACARRRPGLGRCRAAMCRCFRQDGILRKTSRLGARAWRRWPSRPRREGRLKNEGSTTRTASMAALVDQGWCGEMRAHPAHRI